MKKHTFLFVSISMMAVIMVLFSSCLTSLLVAGVSTVAITKSVKNSKKQGKWYGDFQYEVLTTKIVEIKGYKGEKKNVEIPAVIKRKPVTFIGANAFRDKQLTSVIIPDSVYIIENSAFANNQLTNVIIPDRVNKIESNAFDNNQLTNVIIPDSVKIIEDSAFAKNQLTSITIPSSVTGIGTGAFASNKLTSVTITTGVNSIGAEAFANNQLTSVTIPSSVTSIGTGAFRNNQLTSVNIQSSVTYLSGFDHNQLTSVVIPNSVTKIGSSAFANTKLTSVVIPDSVTEISSSAFANTPLTSITIPKTVTKVENNAFAGTIDFYLKAYGINAGKYEKRNERWYYNGTVLQEPSRLVCGDGIYITKIDGKPKYTREDIYLQPGLHTVTIVYSKTVGRTTTYSEGEVTFDYVYTFESDVYDLTGEIQGDKISFRIKRRN